MDGRKSSACAPCGPLTIRSDVMTTNESDLFAPLAAVLATEAPRLNPSELQGVICGLLAAGMTAEEPELCGVLASHAGLRDGWSSAATQIFSTLRQRAWDAFHGDTLELSLLLPDEQQPLAERVAALAVWCEGFMVGFGTGTAGMKYSDLPPSLQEAIADMAAISQVEVPEDEEDDADGHLEQVIEHCRVSALLVFTELALLRRRQKSDNKKTAEPTRH